MHEFFNIENALHELVIYGKQSLGLRPEDAIYAENQLLSLFNCSQIGYGKLIYSDFQSELLDLIVNYAIETGMAEEHERIRFETKVMGIITPAPSIVIDRFDAIASTQGVEEATAYLNDISINSNYIRMSDINKNIRWTHDGPNGKVVVTINLSKPEKDNKQVALEKLAPKNKYPACPLCLENIGFNGTITHPARQTLRIIPIYLNEQNWHIQMSPYVYYKEHCIAFCDEHTPMYVSDGTFARLLDFVEIFPHYFLGSNADLPIVGGSILSHDHYQGGAKVLPMIERDFRKVYSHKDFQKVRIGILDWYNSVIRLTSKSKMDVLMLASWILSCWRDYTDESVDIFSYSGDVPHNTITPVASYENGEYRLDLILRNNRTDADHPDGIFHPTVDMHNIKKEGIGLIEAMGVFILPGRLKNEMEAITEILTAKTKPDFEELNNPENILYKHFNMIIQLCATCGNGCSKAKAESAIKNFINTTCVNILNCTAVFKNTFQGQEGFDRFLRRIGAR